jgi:hypothetical protein
MSKRKDTSVAEFRFLLSFKYFNPLENSSRFTVRMLLYSSARLEVPPVFVKQTNV